MAIEQAMMQFVGAGLSLAAVGIGARKVEGELVPLNGLDVVDRLSREQPGEMSGIVSNATTFIRTQIGQGGVASDQIEHHLVHLAAILQSAELDAEVLSSAFSKADDDQLHDANSTELAGHLATELAGVIRENNAVDARELEPALAYYLFEWLFDSLLQNRSQIFALKPAFEQVFVQVQDSTDRGSLVQCVDGDLAKIDGDDLGEPTDAGNKESRVEGPDQNQKVKSRKQSITGEVIETLASKFGLKKSAISALVDTPQWKPTQAPSSDLVLDERARATVELIKQLNADENRILFSVDLLACLSTAGNALADGDFEQAHIALQKAECIAASDLPRQSYDGGQLSLESSYQLVSMRVFRAKFFEIVTRWRDAALSYEAACRLLPGHAHYERWLLMLGCIDTLARLGAQKNDTDALIEATQIYAEFGGLVSEEDNPLMWANSSLKVGRILMLLGKREARPERFLAAALHFKPAMDVYHREGDRERHAEATFLLAQALRAQGEVQGDVVTLREAENGFRAALEIIKADQDYTMWAEAYCGLGITLQRIGEETGSHDELAAAVECLKVIVDDADKISPLVIAEAKAALGRANLIMASSDQHDDIWLEQAVFFLRAARDVMAREGTNFALADIERRLAGAVIGLSEETGDRANYLDAMELFESARKRYIDQGNVAIAEVLQDDIDELQIRMKVSGA